MPNLERYAAACSHRTRSKTPKKHSIQPLLDVAYITSALECQIPKNPIQPTLDVAYMSSALERQSHKNST